MPPRRRQERPFVGRKDELKQFEQVLASPRGQAVIVVGQAGMGKTMLVDRIADCARDHPELKCGTVRYEVTRTDPPAATMAVMIDHAFEAAQVGKGRLSGTQEQWRALLNLVKIGDLVMSLKRDPQRDTREQFVERLNLISKRMPENGRAIFIVDPEKYMQDGSADDWRLVVRDLPDKIKFVFAQRPEDVLISSSEFMALGNVVRIPDDLLDILDDRGVENLIQAWAGELTQPIKEVRSALRRYHGHPFAVAASLGFLADGAAIAELPADPTKIAQAQWRRICNEHRENAIKLFEAYAILDVAVPDEVVEAVSGVDTSARKALFANPFLAGLLRGEPDGTRIYHSLLGDYILGQVSAVDAKEYHGRAIAVYRQRLTAEAKPDALAAVRLPEHVLAAEGPEAFVKSFVKECGQALLTLGFLDAAVSLSHRALNDFVSPGTVEEAAIRGNLGLVFFTRGDLDQAEEMHRKALAINERIGRLRGVGSAYSNLGAIYQTRGDLDEAEEMHRKSLAIFEKLGRLEGMGSQYGNLGVIYRKRGELDKAEEMFRKSLAIEEQLSHLEGMANAYGNLGSVYLLRGDLEKAEEMLRKSLAIEEKLGRLEGMANDYGNLGNVYEIRGDLKAAREYWTKARDLFKRTGMPHMLEQMQGCLDGLPDTEG